MPHPPADFALFAARPRPPLDRYVESIWAVRGTAPYRRSSVLPNGALQLMVNFGAPHRLLALGTRSADRDCCSSWIAGLQTAPLAIEAPARTDLLSIRFLPGGAHAFLRAPIAALTGAVVDADALLGSAVGELRERLALAPTRAAQVRCAEDWLLARLRPAEHEFRLVAQAVAALGAGAGESVTATCERLGLSNRHLIVLFQRMIGLPPKALARVQRFHSALARLPAARNRAALALELGYADQAHFSNEFRAFAGVSPGDYLARRGADQESLILG